MKSMTGYGRAAVKYENKIINAEIRSINSKGADVYVKIPNIYNPQEVKIIALLKERLVRGKIDCSITIEYKRGEARLDINEELFKDYFIQLQRMTECVNANGDYLTRFLLEREDVNTVVQNVLSIEEENALMQCVNIAIDNMDSYRKTEGEALEKAFYKHIDIIEIYAKDVEPYEKERVPLIREKLMERFRQVQQQEMDKNRFEQEIIFYLEKLDITEERVRLQQHIKYFRECMQNEDILGKKLGFIAQEMGREINTLGSKSLQSDMQRLVVKMKDELEKIKEQLANVL